MHLSPRLKFVLCGAFAVTLNVPLLKQAAASPLLQQNVCSRMPGHSSASWMQPGVHQGRRTALHAAHRLQLWLAQTLEGSTAAA